MMTIEERDAVIERCAVAAENELDGNHEGNLRAAQIATVIRSMNGAPMVPAQPNGATP
jgi:hypothetical protein